MAAAVRAGQFVMLSIPHLRDPLLPRPFAVFDVQGKRIEVLYRTVGKGTGLLSQMREGDLLRILGPLGNGFTLPDPSVKALVLAGGIGIASVHLLLVRLLGRPSWPPTLLYGVRRHEDLIPLDRLDKERLRLRISTDDGSTGTKGTVSDLLSEVLPEKNASASGNTQAFVCGPTAMLKAVAVRMRVLGINGQFSMESRMACGYGVCQGCVLPFRDEHDPKTVRYRKVCTEGPVFSADDIGWEALPS